MKKYYYVILGCPKDYPDIQGSVLYSKTKNYRPKTTQEEKLQGCSIHLASEIESKYNNVGGYLYLKDK